MKKQLILLLAFCASASLHAQWLDDPFNNNFIANTSDDAEEIMLSTDNVSGSTYVQWSDMATNGWSVFLQKLNLDGTPQWGENGIHLSDQDFPYSSEGRAMTATTDNAVISCFANDLGQCIAEKIKANGSFAWGKSISVFEFPEGSQCGKTEILAGNNGGVWVLASDGTRLYLRYVQPNGDLRPVIIITQSGKECVNGSLVPANNNGVFVVYERRSQTTGDYYEKEIVVEGYTFNGESMGLAAQLMSPKTIQASYTPQAISDGMGGGYAYISHPAVLDAFNTYAFHFNENGVSTIGNPNGISMHSPDPDNYYLDAYGTVDPVSHDLILAYRSTNSEQTMSCIYANRVTSTGGLVWGEGVVVENYTSREYSYIKADAFEDGDGFMVSFTHGINTDGVTVEAKGLNMDGNEIWSTQMNAVIDRKTGCKNSTGFHQGQNILVWNSPTEGKLYGQNIMPDGTMGMLTLPSTCAAPSNFQGEYQIQHDTIVGAMLSWETPSEPLLHYNLYYSNIDKSEKEVIEIESTATSYFHTYKPSLVLYELTAVYAGCESTPALTPEGDYFVLVEILELTNTVENTDEEIITLQCIYNIQGQLIRSNDLEQLTPGIYILQGQNRKGKLVNKKIIIQ